MRSIGLMLAVKVCCCAAVGCNSASKPVMRVLRADHELATMLKGLPSNAPPSQVAQAIRQYCEHLEDIDMSDCPPDFRVAYRDHLRAWREAHAAIEQLPDGYLDGFFIGTLNVIIRHESDAGIGRLEGDLKRAMERVRDTWTEVERIGAKYGAAL